jgi:S-adenosylmethionine:tRNA ribosyltransferase-isomerase
LYASRLRLYASRSDETLHLIPDNARPMESRHSRGADSVLTSEFDFDLPDELIAQHPFEPRDRSRLMVIDRRGGCWEHRRFADLPELLDRCDVLARNTTRVLPARLVGRRQATGGKWEGLFLREHPDGTWEILATTRGRPAIGERVVVGQGLRLVLQARGAGGSWIVRPDRDDRHRDQPAVALLEQHGQTPLPPYIRGGRELPGDSLAYQTVYARQPGSVAAPTAGLHFTDEVFARLDARGIAWADLTLHVGLGTFRPMEVDRLEDHVMHAEWAEISAAAIETLQDRRRLGGRIVAIGTTSARTLEAAAADGTLRPFSGETRLFIRPGHAFHALDALITNFHLPRSSLLVLVSAFAGLDLVRAAYAEAIAQRYRFFSYGDAMLIL